ncbi:hypothetical protein FRC17_001667 [Serendipita sp. 399]|nr:hypothetical protein FRC17_001667 [Serendipita sp. 399]
MKAYIAAAFALATAVLAQTNSTGIPSDASTDCQNFLRTLNSDTTTQTCLNVLIDATSEFDPSVTGSNTLNATAINQALGKICMPSFNSTCTQHIREQLGQFYSSCRVDLLGQDGQGGKPAVIAIYDVLYLITPLRGAICSKDSKGYCINQLSGISSSSSSGAASASSSASAAASSVPAKRAEDLYKRQTTVDGQETLGSFAPNTTTYNHDGLPYLFLTDRTPREKLCQPCTAKIVSSYVAFEDVTPYALGLAHSPILSGQFALWKKIKEQCGSDVVTEILGSVSSGGSSSGALARVDRGSAVFTAAGAIIAGLAALAM